MIIEKNKTYVIKDKFFDSFIYHIIIFNEDISKMVNISFNNKFNVPDVTVLTSKNEFGFTAVQKIILDDQLLVRLASQEEENLLQKLCENSIEGQSVGLNDEDAIKIMEQFPHLFRE